MPTMNVSQVVGAMRITHIDGDLLRDGEESIKIDNTSTINHDERTQIRIPCDERGSEKTDVFITEHRLN